jgi:hypothetical protein
MTITREQVLALRPWPCRSFLNWYEGNEETDALKLLLQVNDVSPSWATWGFTHAMSKNQCVRIAIYCAELVIGIYEDWDGATDDPRKAIELAKAWLNNPFRDAANPSLAPARSSLASVRSSIAAGAPFCSVCAAYCATYCAASYAAACSSLDARDVSLAPSCAVYAARCSTYCAASYVARKETQEKIIREAVRILEEGDY